MQIITAYVKPELVSDVVYALHETEGVRGASLSRGEGFGAWRLDESTRALEKEESNYRPHVRIEVVCADEYSTGIQKTILSNASTGKPGDGIVVAAPVESCVKISNGEPGA